MKELKNYEAFCRHKIRLANGTGTKNPYLTRIKSMDTHTKKEKSPNLLYNYPVMYSLKNGKNSNYYHQTALLNLWHGIPISLCDILYHNAHFLKTKAFVFLSILQMITSSVYKTVSSLACLINHNHRCQHSMSPPLLGRFSCYTILLAQYKTTQHSTHI